MGRFPEVQGSKVIQQQDWAWVWRGTWRFPPFEEDRVLTEALSTTFVALWALAHSTHSYGFLFPTCLSLFSRPFFLGALERLVPGRQSLQLLPEDPEERMSSNALAWVSWDMLSVNAWLTLLEPICALSMFHSLTYLAASPR